MTRPEASDPVSDPVSVRPGVAPRWARLTFAGLGAVYLGLCLHYMGEIGPLVVDDAFIVFRYADNFATGNGLVYNPGDPVEGYTSFTWTVLLGVVVWLGLPLLAVSQLLGVGLGLGPLALTWWIARRLLPRSEWLALGVVAMVATNRSASIWAVEPLETKLFGFTILATLAVWVYAGAGGHWRRVPVVGLAAAVMALTRPEGFMYAGWLGLVGVLPAARTHRGREFLLNGAVFVGIVLAHLGFRLSFYDAWLPNTFHAKVVGWQFERGADYLLRLSRANGLIAYGWMVPVGGLLGHRVSSHAAARVWCGLVVVSSFGYWWAIGGDYFEFRFFGPVLPLWALLVGLGVAALADGRPVSVARPAAFGAGALALLANGRSVVSPYHGDGQVTSPERSTLATEQFLLAARWLATNVPAHESLAIRPAGAIAYFSGLTCIDELGLTDREIARSAGSVVDGPVGHQREVSAAYLRGRGATYYVGHPVLLDHPVPSSTGYISAEVSRGVYLILARLDPDATLQPRLYPLGDGPSPLTGWAPVRRTKSGSTGVGPSDP